MVQAYPGPKGCQTAANLGRGLMVSLDCLARLEYLAESLPAGRLPTPTSTLSLSHAKFEARHPSFPAWLAPHAARLERNNPPLRLRRAGGA